MRNQAIWFIAAFSTAGVVLRPWRVPEAVWAVSGAIALVALRLIPMGSALQAVAKGNDVYLFLAGMMLLSETARREGVFDYLAGIAVVHAKGSAHRLFLLVYGVGTLVTALMSNDATAVVLTPAVYAATKKAGVNPTPYLFVCALVANAASFVLPISNPANLVVYGEHLPSLSAWARQFALPSFLSIVATYAVIKWFYAKELSGRIEGPIQPLVLTPSGLWAIWGIAGVTGALLVASATNAPLGMTAALTCAGVAGAICLRKRESPWPVLKGVSWSVLPLVAGLFVLVESLARSGVLDLLSQTLARFALAWPQSTAFWSGVGLAISCNLVNNLPAGLIAGTTAASAHASPLIQGAIAIGIDVGPNLSITGSLATILWLIALRREGESVSGWQFLRLGAVAMPTALLLALGGYFLGQHLP